MNLRDLAAPFPASDIEWRVQSAGQKGDKVWARVLAYINNRAIMERLDEVCGPENWRNEFRHEPSGAVLCGISIRTGEGFQAIEWVTKWDGAEKTDIEAVKGGLSNAMKRAGVQWGIGRYLYQLEEGYANVNDRGEHYQAAKAGKYPAFKWDPPALPAWALPGGSGKPNTTRTAARQSSPADNGRAPQGDGGIKSPAPASAAPSTNARSAARPAQSSPSGDGGSRNAVAATVASTEKPDEAKVWGGKTLGEHSDAELNEIVRDFKNDPKPALKALVKACRNVLNTRLLGPKPTPPAPLDQSDDARVARMKAGVAAENATLPFD